MAIEAISQGFRGLGEEKRNLVRKIISGVRKNYGRW
jgi:hypothetical protein